MTRTEILQKIARCDREIELCRDCMRDPSKSHHERSGANLGEVDWLDSRLDWMKELALLEEKEAA